MSKAKQRLFLYIKRFILNLFYRFGEYFEVDSRTLSVLCYHAIENGGNFYSVGREEFERQIEKIRKSSRFISVYEALKVLDGKKIKEPSVLLTIDDGYANVMKILPITQKYKIPVAIFVLSDPKQANRDELDHNGRLLTFGEIKYLHYSAGWTIGCHSATHANFKRLNNKQLKYEIKDAKIAFEKKLGFTIDYFAYPKGIYNEKIIEIVKKAGYKAAFAVLPNNVNENYNKFVIPRIVINKTHILSDFPVLYSNTTLLLRKIIDRYSFLGKLNINN